MDSSNAIVEDNLDDGSNFTQIGMDMGQINEKMQKMEVNKFNEYLLIPIKLRLN
jgi:hypothetical protein